MYAQAGDTKLVTLLIAYVPEVSMSLLPDTYR